MEKELGATELNICPRCNYAFLLFMIPSITDGVPDDLRPIVASQQGSVPIYCPACGGDINSYKQEINVDLDKLNKWRNWANPI